MLTVLTQKSRIIFILPLIGALSMLSTCSRTVTITRVIDGDTYTKYPCDMTDTLRTLEREAREARRGLWGE